MSDAVPERLGGQASVRADLSGNFMHVSKYTGHLSCISSRPLGMVSESTMTIATAFLSTPLSLLGWQFKPVAQAKAKKVQIPIFIRICVIPIFLLV